MAKRGVLWKAILHELEDGPKSYYEIRKNLRRLYKSENGLFYALSELQKEKRILVFEPKPKLQIFYLPQHAAQKEAVTALLNSNLHLIKQDANNLFFASQKPPSESGLFDEDEDEVHSLKLLFAAYLGVIEKEEPKTIGEKVYKPFLSKRILLDALNPEEAKKERERFWRMLKRELNNLVQGSEPEWVEPSLSKDMFEEQYFQAILKFVAELSRENWRVLANYLINYLINARYGGELFDALTSLVGKRYYYVESDLQRELVNRVLDFLVFLHLLPPLLEKGTPIPNKGQTEQEIAMIRQNKELREFAYKVLSYKLIRIQQIGVYRPGPLDEIRRNFVWQWKAFKEAKQHIKTHELLSQNVAFVLSTSADVKTPEYYVFKNPFSHYITFFEVVEAMLKLFEEKQKDPNIPDNERDTITKEDLKKTITVQKFVEVTSYKKPEPGLFLSGNKLYERAEVEIPLSLDSVYDYSSLYYFREKDTLFEILDHDFAVQDIMLLPEAREKAWWLKWFKLYNEIADLLKQRKILQPQAIKLDVIEAVENEQVTRVSKTPLKLDLLLLNREELKRQSKPSPSEEIEEAMYNIESEQQ